MRVQDRRYFAASEMAGAISQRIIRPPRAQCLPIENSDPNLIKLFNVVTDPQCPKYSHETEEDFVRVLKVCTDYIYAYDCMREYFDLLDETAKARNQKKGKRELNGLVKNLEQAKRRGFISLGLGQDDKECYDDGKNRWEMLDAVMALILKMPAPITEKDVTDEN